MATPWANLSSLIDEGLPIQQKLQANQTAMENVYKSDFSWVCTSV